MEISWKASYHIGSEWGGDVETKNIIFKAPANIRLALDKAESLIPEGAEIEDIGCM
jgi:hypothetical protein